ncbi:hypothetical protein EAG_12181 [Camponotus floridanus]|uniref:Uncharacterized protein n=1 Tax=Camponotus floridanus TaxID=104421 RepID=E2AZY4_CAMFO|nr:hypothetical protein EAG_12181 [Camponotus floridanus]
MMAFIDIFAEEKSSPNDPRRRQIKLTSFVDPAYGISHSDPLLSHESVAREHEEWQKCPRGISHRGSLICLMQVTFPMGLRRWVYHGVRIERLKYCPEENTGSESSGAAT